MKVAIIDYGMGNIYSIQSALSFIEVESEYTNVKENILKSDRIILPGVGSFRKAMQHIQFLELDKILKEAVYELNIPVLGICLGMQLLGKSSTEDGFTEGLGIFNGLVTKFNFDDPSIKVPHVGFNSVINPSNSALYKNISENSDFYFVHSYKMSSSETDGIGYCNYVENFVASFEQHKVFGTQFHPEKSQTNGLRLLKNFIDLSR
jgi:imidazole glycerol-phosphate synthase subunit HisH